MLDLMSIDGGSLIAAALATGAQTGATETVKAGVQLLKDKLKSVFAGDDDALADLNRYARKPSSDVEEDLLRHLARYGMTQNQELADLAHQILENAGPRAAGDGAVAATNLAQTINGDGSAYVGGVHNTTNYLQAEPTRVAEPRWEASRMKGSRYWLRNTGEAAAYNVKLEAKGFARFIPPENLDPTWHQGDARSFLGARTNVYPSRHLKIQYSVTPDGPSQTRVIELP